MIVNIAYITACFQLALFIARKHYGKLFIKTNPYSPKFNVFILKTSVENSNFEILKFKGDQKVTRELNSKGLLDKLLGSHLFKNVSISYKIIALSTIALLGTFLVVGIGYLSLNKMATGQEEFANTTDMSMVSNDIKVNALEMERYGKDFLLTKSESSITNFETYLQNVKDKAEEIVDYTDDPKIAEASGKVMLLVDEYQEIFDAVYDLNDIIEMDGASAETTAEMNTIMADLSRVYGQMEPVFQTYVDSANKALVSATHTLEDTHSGAETMLLVFCTVMIVVVGLIAFLILKSISIPLANLRSAVDVIATGDYTKEVRGKTRKDELGQFSNAIEDLRKAALESERLAAENKRAEEDRLAHEAEEREAEAQREREDAERVRIERETAEARATQINSTVMEFDTKVSEVLNALASSSTELEATANQMVIISDSTTTRASDVASAA